MSWPPEQFSKPLLIDLHMALYKHTIWLSSFTTGTPILWTNQYDGMTGEAEHCWIYIADCYIPLYPMILQGNLYDVVSCFLQTIKSMLLNLCVCISIYTKQYVYNCLYINIYDRVYPHNIVFFVSRVLIPIIVFIFHISRQTHYTKRFWNINLICLRRHPCINNMYQYINM